MPKSVYKSVNNIPVGELEEWRSIDGYEGLYEVSSLGRVRRTPTTIIEMTEDGTIVSERSRDYYHLTPTLNVYGYYQLGLTIHNKTTVCHVHLLVARAFLNMPDDGAEVHHIDRISTNNRLDNLAWVSKAEHSRIHSHKNSRTYLSDIRRSKA